jgi:hypothetical protein
LTLGRHCVQLAQRSVSVALGQALDKGFGNFYLPF